MRVLSLFDGISCGRVALERAGIPVEKYFASEIDRHAPRINTLVNGYIRKLTPVECERLQTLPDKYTACVSDSQRYKALGNGWTVDVIAHIFKGIKQ